jgi:hypothetical protein
MTQPPYAPPPEGQAYPPADAQQPPAEPFYKKPWAIAAGVLVALVVIVSAIKGGGNTDTTAASSTTSPSPVVTTVVPPPPAPATVTVTAQPPATSAAPTTEAAPPGVNFTMPDFVGMDLQTAQDLVQTNGVFLSRSHDLLGSRMQVIDSNWIVCTQNIPAGKQVTGDAEGAIDFGVVKREESCP